MILKPQDAASAVESLLQWNEAKVGRLPKKGYAVETTYRVLMTREEYRRDTLPEESEKRHQRLAERVLSVVDSLPRGVAQVILTWVAKEEVFYLAAYETFLTLDRTYQVGRKLGRSHFLRLETETWEEIPAVAGEVWARTHKPKVID